MFQLDDEIRDTQFYKDVFQEGKVEGHNEEKLEMVRALLAEGVSVEQIARAAKLPIEEVRQIATRKP